ncbi:MAG: recombinase family protein [Candidatus Korobacteraceae bacterium]
MRVALYARVSTLNGQDPGMQLRELRDYAARRDLQVVDEYTDHGVSGSRESRPELNRLMADAKQRKFDAVLVWKVDRFGRSLRHLVNALAELGALGVAFVSIRDNLDLSTPSGRLMFAVIGAMAEFERSLIQERVRAGIRNARANGKALGRPRRIVDGNAIAQLQTQGMSVRKIARTLGVGYLQHWHRETMYAKSTDWVFASTKLKGAKPRCGSIASQTFLYPAAAKAGVFHSVEKRNRKGKIVSVRYFDLSGKPIKRWGWHTLRHSLASWLISSGVDVKTVSSILRHSNIKTTLGIYSHAVDSNKLAAQGQFLGRLLGGESVQ